jgi:hypothetical protein
MILGVVGFPLSALVVMELRCDGGSGVVEIFKGVEAFPLSSYPFAVLGKLGGSSLSAQIR